MNYKLIKLCKWWCSEHMQDLRDMLVVRGLTPVRDLWDAGLCKRIYDQYWYLFPDNNDSIELFNILTETASGSMHLDKEDLIYFEGQLYEKFTILHETQAKKEYPQQVCQVLYMQDLTCTKVSELLNALEEANKIVNLRSEEKNRQYGSFSESMERTVQLFNLIRKRDLSPEDAYWMLVCLKLSREGITHKQDNIIDACAYLGALDNYINENKNK